MKKIIGLVIATFILQTVMYAQVDKRKKEFNTEKNNLALSGYDPVAYFKQAKAVEGNKNFALVYEGIIYYFSTRQNEETFKANPTHYEPQYGGWCAYAMGEKGEKVEIDPETFKIVNDKLYLFYNKYFNNTLKSWNKKEPLLKGKADVNWQKIINSQ